MVDFGDAGAIVSCVRAQEAYAGAPPTGAGGDRPSECLTTRPISGDCRDYVRPVGSPPPRASYRDPTLRKRVMQMECISGGEGWRITARRDRWATSEAHSRLGRCNICRIRHRRIATPCASRSKTQTPRWAQERPSASVSGGGPAPRIPSFW